MFIFLIRFRVNLNGIKNNNNNNNMHKNIVIMISFTYRL